MNENETIVVDGTQVPFETVPAGNMEIIPVDNGDENDGYDSDLTTGQALLGVAIIGAAGYGLGKFGELAWRKALKPGARKFGNWILSMCDKSDQKEKEKDAEKEQQNAANNQQNNDAGNNQQK